MYLAEKKTTAASSEVATAAVVEEDVDVALAACDGKIERKRDPQL